MNNDDAGEGLRALPGVFFVAARPSERYRTTE